MPGEMKRLRDVEENSRLKRCVADLSLDKEMLQDVIKRKLQGLSASARLVAEMASGWGVSLRRACRLMRLDPTTYRYRSRRSGQAALATRIKEICAIRVRYGYRRAHVPLRREGWANNAKGEVARRPGAGYRHA